MYKRYFEDEYVSNRTGKEIEIGEIRGWPSLLRVLNEQLSILIFSQKCSQGPQTFKASVMTLKRRLGRHDSRTVFLAV